MPKLTGGRPEFRKWVDGHPDPGWPLMPLTHITKGIGAEDIIRDGQVTAAQCEVFNEPLAYLFYGRPAYRVSGDGAVKLEGACPYCFIFRPELIREAKAIFAFDTGAFDKRMYKHMIMDEMKVEDFLLGTDERRPNKIIAAVFSEQRIYFDGDVTKMAKPDKYAAPWEFLAKSYLYLLASPGRNEPDDRICSIEIVFDKNIPLVNHLMAVVVPHTLWDGGVKAPWLDGLHKNNVEIEPYLFVPGRHPEHYHALLESQVRALYVKWGIL
jgi:hypothetical protein